ncbi:hypothetical protein GCM10009105_08940 [Dokdonella soli]|uniref:Uncharacterized protein n=1 Tax=Dokdonella soli TaxID=529810 RepID=A0ABN1IDX3_9GAMM
MTLSQKWLGFALCDTPHPISVPSTRAEEAAMSKGMDQKKSDKKKPAKTMKEKKAEKNAKKAAKGH